MDERLRGLRRAAISGGTVEYARFLNALRLVGYSCTIGDFAETRSGGNPHNYDPLEECSFCDDCSTLMCINHQQMVSSCAHQHDFTALKQSLIDAKRPCDFCQEVTEGHMAQYPQDTDYCFNCQKYMCVNCQYHSIPCDICGTSFCCSNSEPEQCPQHLEQDSWLCAEHVLICHICGIGGCKGHENEIGTCDVCKEDVCVGAATFGPQPPLWVGEEGDDQTNRRCSTKCVKCMITICNQCDGSISRCRYCRHTVCDDCLVHGRCGMCNRSPQGEPDFLPDFDELGLTETEEEATGYSGEEIGYPGSYDYEEDDEGDEENTYPTVFDDRDDRDEYDEDDDEDIDDDDFY